MKQNEIIELTNWLEGNIEDYMLVDIHNQPVSKNIAISDIVYNFSQGEMSEPLLSTFDALNASSVQSISSGKFSKDFNFGVASFKVSGVYDLNSKNGEINVASKVFGVNLGTSKTNFEKGVLQKSETLDLKVASLEYNFKLGFSGGVKGTIVIKVAVKLGFLNKKGSWTLNFWMTGRQYGGFF